jgi:(+)-pinoresinol hydroxylase
MAKAAAFLQGQIGMKLATLTLALATCCLMLTAAHAQDATTPDGKALFDKWCGICHAAGPMRAGTMALQVKYKGALPAELEKRTDLNATVVALIVRRGINFMPPFRKTELSDKEVAAVSAYIARTNG